MHQITSGIRSVLSSPFIYSLFGQLMGGNRSRAIFVDNYIRPQKGDRILDIGCGPGDLIPYLPEVEYLGFDISEEYITTAKKQFGSDNIFFRCERVSTSNLSQQSYFDLVLAVGILHHLDEVEALELFQIAEAALKPGGRLITFDGVFVGNQSPCAKWILSKDRGQNIRTKDEYIALASKIFSDISCSIRHDLLRIPYTHIILECIK
jgi:cyclopropane fatty-acyl-phospholipid synthase-like methyltransferase